jgi:hypothetical protein
VTLTVEQLLRDDKKDSGAADTDKAAAEQTFTLVAKKASGATSPTGSSAQASRGELVVEPRVIYLASALDASEDAEGAGVPQSVIIPGDLWAMQTPLLRLSVRSASGLSRVSSGMASLTAAGSTTSAFVVAYLGSDDEPVFQTEVVRNSLAPSWEFTFDVPLGVTMERGKTVVQDFPALRFELYHRNSAFSDNTFLGACTLPAARYLRNKSAELQLSTLEGKKEGHVQGALQLLFAVEDAVSLLTQGYFFSAYHSLQPTTVMEVQVVSGQDLMRANGMLGGGKSDPFVKIVWNGVEQGKTAHQSNTLEPRWKDERFTVNLGNSALTRSASAEEGSSFWGLRLQVRIFSGRVS